MSEIRVLETQGRRGLLRENGELLAALALVCLYGAIMSGHLTSIDGLLMYRQGLSLAYGHSFHFAAPIWWGSTYTTSKYGIGLSLLYLPGLLLWSLLAPWVPAPAPNSFDWALYFADPLYVVAGAPVHLLVTAASAYLVARFLRELGFGGGTALWGLALYGLASPAVVYARGDWAQPLEGLCWIGALYSAVVFRRSEDRRALWLCALALCYGVLTRPVEGTLLLPAAVLSIAASARFGSWRGRDLRTAALLLAAYGLGVGVTLLVDAARFGSPFITGYEGEGWTTPLGVGLPGTLLSPGRGIVWEFPAILLLGFGVWRLWSTEFRRLALVLAALAGLQLLNVAAWDQWPGGWSWGLRLFVPALPVVAVLSAAGIPALPAPMRRWLPTLLFLGGVVWVVPCVLTSLLGGYASAFGDSASSFSWQAYPPIGAWRFFHHWRALAIDDSGGADILWLRVARFSGNASFVPFAALLAGSALLWRRALGTVSHGEAISPAVEYQAPAPRRKTARRR